MSRQGAAPPSLLSEVSVWRVQPDGALRRQAVWQRGPGSEASLLPHPLRMGDAVDWSPPPLARSALGPVAARVTVRSGDALVVLGVAASGSVAAAMEVWHAAAGAAHLELDRAWYSTAAAPLAGLSRAMHIGWGSGLPGMAAELSAPVLLQDLAHSETFLRSYSAARTRLHHGLALPVEGGRAAVVLMSAEAAPLALRTVLLSCGEPPRLLAGHCREEGNLFGTAPDAPWMQALHPLLAGLERPQLMRAGAPGWAALAPAAAEVLLAWPFPQATGSPRALLLWL